MTVYKENEEWIMGSEVQVNDVLDVEDKPFTVKKLGEYTGPAHEVTGPGRIATSDDGELLTILDGQQFRRWDPDWRPT